MAEIDELDDIADEEGEQYWRESEMQAQILAGGVGEMTTVREYPDIPARVLGEARPEAAEALWNAVEKWAAKNDVESKR